MILPKSFKISFITTTIFLFTIFAFLLTDYNTKNMNFKDSPYILKIENKTHNCYTIEIIGNKYSFEPIKISSNNTYKYFIRPLIPQKIKLIEDFLCYSYAAYKDLINHKYNLDYLNNVRNIAN